MNPIPNMRREITSGFRRNRAAFNCHETSGRINKGVALCQLTVRPAQTPLDLLLTPIKSDVGIY